MNIDEWYSALVQLCNEALKQVPELDKIKMYFEQQYSPEDTFDALYNRGAVTITQPGTELTQDSKPSDHLKQVLESPEYPHMTEQDVIARIYSKEFSLTPSGAMVLCELTMKNRWRFVGKWAPLSGENFDVEKGKSRALTDAIRQAWDFEAYLRKEQMYREYEELLKKGQ